MEQQLLSAFSSQYWHSITFIVVFVSSSLPFRGFLALISRSSLAGRAAPDCKHAQNATPNGPQGAIDEADATRFSKSECIMCMDCDVACPFDINMLSWSNLKNWIWKKDQDIKLDIPRHFIWSVGGAGISIPFLKSRENLNIPTRKVKAPSFPGK